MSVPQSAQLNFEVPDIYGKIFESNFKNRLGSLSEALGNAERVHGKELEQRAVKTAKEREQNAQLKTRRLKKKYNLSMKSFYGKESIFKVPETPLPRICLKSIVTAASKSPRNRGKWTKYSLADVDLVSDSGNRSAAFSFLQELKDRKSQSEETDVSGRVVSMEKFKPVFKKRENEKKNIKTNFQSTKKTSNEVQCSSLKKKAIGANSKETEPRCQIKLNHLEEEEVIEDE